MKALLTRLNDKFGTSYNIEDNRNVLEALQMCIAKNYDFGMAYALLRNKWRYIDASQPSGLHLADQLNLEDKEKSGLKRDFDSLKQD
jgi:hypothetical protein